MTEVIQRAFADVGAAFKLRGLWVALASEDVAESHRRTVLGPLWPLLNYVLFAGSIIIVLGHGVERDEFTAYVASGLLVWLFISEILSQSATLFIREASFIKGTVLPISIYVLRQTMLTAVRSGYALLGAVPLVLFSGVELTQTLWTLVPAFLLLLVTAPAVGVLFGFAGVYFRDFQFVVSHSVRLLMFVTPIFWMHGGGGGLRGVIYYWNPLTHYIDIVRRPVIDGVVPIHSWAVTGTVSVFLVTAALLVLGSLNRRLVFQL
jgi:ABC-type polysaccharide/polyol phosphate export permease